MVFSILHTVFSILYMVFSILYMVISNLVYCIWFSVVQYDSVYFSKCLHLQASEDSLRNMGNRKFYDQMLQDAMYNQQYKITDEIDVTTLKDYMQVCIDLKLYWMLRYKLVYIG